MCKNVLYTLCPYKNKEIRIFETNEFEIRIILQLLWCYGF